MAADKTHEDLFEYSEPTVGELLEKNYTIPAYQRPFKWTADQVRDLWNDIVSLEGDERHYLGTVFLIGEDVDSPYEVVDGQQRLTSIQLLVGALTAEIAEHDLSKAVSARAIIINQAGTEDSLRIVSAIEGDYARKLLLETISKSDRAAFFADPAHLHDDYKIIGAAYQAMEEFISCHLDEGLFSPAEIPAECERLLSQIKTKLTCSRLTSTRHISSYKLFEALNARGLDLTLDERVKNLVFSRSEEDELSEVQECWAAIQKIFRDPLGLAKYEFGEFLKDFTVLTVDKDATLKETYRTLDRWFRTGANALDFARELKTTADFLNRAVTRSGTIPEDVKKSLEWLDTFKMSAVWPAILAAGIAKWPVDSREFACLARWVENFHVRYYWKKKCSGDTRAVGSETYYKKSQAAGREIIAAFRGGKPSRVGLYNCRRVFIENLKPKGEKRGTGYKKFMSDLETIWFKEGEGLELAAYLLWRIEDQELPKGFGVPKRSVIAHVEHIYPKTPGAEWSFKKMKKFHSDLTSPEGIRKHLELRNRLGNLVLLERNLNNHIKNKAYDYKFEHGYWHSKYDLPKKTAKYRVGSYDPAGGAAISPPGSWLAQSIYNFQGELVLLLKKRAMLYI